MSNNLQEVVFLEELRQQVRGTLRPPKFSDDDVSKVEQFSVFDSSDVSRERENTLSVTFFTVKSGNPPASINARSAAAFTRQKKAKIDIAELLR